MGKISRETYQEMLLSTPGLTQKAMVGRVLKLASVEVEEPAVLPGISDNLFYEEHGDRWYIYDRNITDERTQSGFACVGDRPCSALKEPYARLWCAAPKVVKASVAVLNGKADPQKWNRLHEVLKEAGAKI